MKAPTYISRLAEMLAIASIAALVGGIWDGQRQMRNDAGRMSAMTVSGPFADTPPRAKDTYFGSEIGKAPEQTELFVCEDTIG